MKIVVRIKQASLLLIALILAPACSPPASLSAPPIADANAIQLYIQQTAAAAATQTQNAQPFASVTPTITFTPRSTFTLEATATFMPPLEAQSLPSQPNVQYYRIKHDNQLAMYNYTSRTQGADWRYPKQTPEIAQLMPDPSTKAGTFRTELNSAWEKYMDELNNNNFKKLHYLKRDDIALFNWRGFPFLDSLTMGGNIIVVETIQNGWGRVKTLDFDQPPSADKVNYMTDPDLVHKFVLVTWNPTTKRTLWVETPHGPIYWPFVTGKPAWIQMELLEPFPTLPRSITATVTQPFRVEPKADSALSKFDFTQGNSAMLLQYYPSGSDVWGLLDNGRWISLFRYTKDGPTYFTTWFMETLPPIP